MQRLDWDDLRYILAVAEEGTVSGAARRLGVNHSTVLRRISQFEEGYGGQIFDKTPRGYSLSNDRGRILDAIREVERSAQVVNRLLEGEREPLAGELRVTSTDSLCQLVLPTVVERMAAIAPGLHVTLISSNTVFDLAAAEADLIVRPTRALPEEMFGERAGVLSFGLYCAKAQADVDIWLGVAGHLSRSLPGRWLADNVDPEMIGDKSDSFMSLREMVARGRGRAILPTYVGDADPRLSVVAGVLPAMQVDIWVASHADLANVPRIAAMRRLLADQLRANAELLK